MEAINYLGQKVEFSRQIPADEAAKCGKGVADKIRSMFAKKAAAGPCACVLKLSQARYVGTKQASYSDDSYTVIPYEGEIDVAARNRIGQIYECRNGYSFNAYIDQPNKQIVIYEYQGIGD